MPKNTRITIATTAATRAIIDSSWEPDWRFTRQWSHNAAAPGLRAPRWDRDCRGGRAAPVRSGPADGSGGPARNGRVVRTGHDDDPAQIPGQDDRAV